MNQSAAGGRFDQVIVGAGILGLATAREFLLRFPGARVAVLEKEAALARHQTGHNSGVIHTGVYYRPGSLKARLCVNGREALLRFCDEKNIPYTMIGKLIVAIEERERANLEELGARGRANGVQGIESLSAGAIREREPHVTGVAALWIPQAGIVDYGAVADALAADARGLGAEILLDHEIRSMARDATGLRLETNHGPIATRRMIACAGLQGDRVAKLSAPVNDLRIIPFRGDYYRLAPAARSLVHAMIYPVPDPRYPFLGVHFTPRMDGEVWAGPNAVLSLAREVYSRTGFVLRDVIEMIGWPGLWRIMQRHWAVGVTELWRDWVKETYARDLRRYVPALRTADLLPGPCGIRAQAVARDGAFVEDFAFLPHGPALHVVNAPSPAATSSLAIAKEIVERASATPD